MFVADNKRCFKDEMCTRSRFMRFSMTLVMMPLQQVPDKPLQLVRTLTDRNRGQRIGAHHSLPDRSRSPINYTTGFSRIKKTGAMKSSVKYTFPLDGAISRPQAFENIKGVGVTGFTSLARARMLYLGSLTFSILLIVLDSLLIWTLNRHTGVVGASVNIVENEHTWGVICVGVMLSCDLLVLFTQGIDLAYFHFTLWPLTALTWFGQLNGTGLSSAILGMVMNYPHSDASMRDEKLSLAVWSLAAHAIFISSQLAVTLEYIMRSLPRK